MSKTTGPEIVFLRWVLSHLTLIVVLSFAIYIYWSKDEIWPTERITEDSKSQYAEELIISDSQAKPVEKTHSDSEAVSAPIVSHSSSDFAHRMKLYRQTLSVEEQEIMDNAEKSFQYAPLEGTIKYPDEDEIEAELTVSKNLNANRVEEETADNTNIEQEDVLNISANKYTANDEIKIKREKKPNKIDSKMQTGILQKQIRNRQRELQDQMLMLIPLTSETKALKQPKAVKPVINTQQQRTLLMQARRAFDGQEYQQAEKKYLQLIKELPELPDVVGELANLYRIDNKTSEYLETNTQFITRLVNHNRFDEAWRVFSATKLLDKKIAAQQRLLIKNKEEQ